MTTRIAAPDDADEIARIQVLTWRHAYRGLVPDEYLNALSTGERSAMWQQSIETGSVTVLVAEEEGAMCGWISIGPSRDADAGASTGEVWALYVRPTAWSRGLARSLWRAARERLVADDMTTASLWVFADNPRARSAYEHLGWRLEPDSGKTFELGGKTMREVRYRIKLA
jgi:ribosomal protein S18 acetylase RimI-like enzyme